MKNPVWPAMLAFAVGVFALVFLVAIDRLARIDVRPATAMRAAAMAGVPGRAVDDRRGGRSGTVQPRLS